jgi:hypothetical protein
MHTEYGPPFQAGQPSSLARSTAEAKGRPLGQSAYQFVPVGQRVLMLTVAPHDQRVGATGTDHEWLMLQPTAREAERTDLPLERGLDQTPWPATDAPNEPHAWGAIATAYHRE